MPPRKVEQAFWSWLHIVLTFAVISVATSAVVALVVVFGFGLSVRTAQHIDTAVQFLEAVLVYRWAKRRPTHLEDL